MSDTRNLAAACRIRVWLAEHEFVILLQVRPAHLGLVKRRAGATRERQDWVKFFKLPLNGLPA